VLGLWVAEVLQYGEGLGNSFAVNNDFHSFTADHLHRLKTKSQHKNKNDRLTNLFGTRGFDCAFHFFFFYF
jgi:hypothetical protein